MARIVKSDKEIANEKSESILQGVAAWCGFYRSNPQRFCKDYLNITLKRFQKILIYEMMHNNHVIAWAGRSVSKTWTGGLFSVLRCILYPGTKICIASATRTQANEILGKITDDFMKNYSWGSENLKREISYAHVGMSEGVIKFHNGSWIKVVTASDSSRGNRANIVLLDEFRMLDKTTIDTVIKRFLGNPRHPLYLDLKEYKNRKDLLEMNKEMYLSSAWLKINFIFTKMAILKVMSGDSILGVAI